jgi:cytochrome P450
MAEDYVNRALEDHAGHFDLRDEEFNDPTYLYDVYRAMREHGTIVHTDRSDFGGRHPESWVIIGYEEAREALRDTRLSSDARTVLGYDSDQGAFADGTSVISMDSPTHGELRQILNPYFSPKQAKLLEPATRSAANRLIDRFIEDGHADLAQVAWDLPGEVLFREVLGIPMDLVDECLHWHGVSMHGDDQETRNQGTAKVIEIVAQELMSRRERDERRGDAIDAMFAGTIDGRPLTTEELVGNSYLLVVAGLETTSNALSSVYYWLAHHGEERDRLARDSSLVPAAVEEFLRYVGSVHSLLRFVPEDMEVAGHSFSAGEVIQIAYAAANRDPDEFPDADECVLARRQNRHLAFGAGAHRCLGSNLARMELRVGLEVVLERLPDYRIADEEGCRFVGTYVTRGYHSLPISFTPGRRLGGDR